MMLTDIGCGDTSYPPDRKQCSRAHIIDTAIVADRIEVIGVTGD
jgi:hypothetical protein